MGEIGSPSDPAEPVVEAKTQGEDEATKDTQEDVNTMEAGGAAGSNGAEAKKATQENSLGAAETRKEEEEPKPSKLKMLWEKLGLDAITLILMFK